MKLGKNQNLAELIGIILGDGNLGNYPKYTKKKSELPRCHYLRIYCNLKEKQYAREVRKILEYVFKKKSYLHKRSSESILYLEISLKNLDRALGLPIGDKIKNKIGIPDWILKNRKYTIACLRGLFDTDGCCYITGRKYRIVNFTNKNEILLRDVNRALKLLGFHPYKRGEKNIELGQQKEASKFFKTIKPRNIKHYRHHAEVANVVTAPL